MVTVSAPTRDLDPRPGPGRSAVDGAGRDRVVRTGEADQVVPADPAQMALADQIGQLRQRPQRGPVGRGAQARARRPVPTTRATFWSRLMSSAVRPACLAGRRSYGRSWGQAGLMHLTHHERLGQLGRPDEADQE